MDSTADSILVSWLGKLPFQSALAKQIETREAIVQGLGHEHIYLCEHNPVLTLGRRGKASDILWDQTELDRQGVELCETPRGGEVTLHAPGQLVIYPVVRTGTQVRRHILQLADTTIATLRKFGLNDCFYRADHPGVWLGPTQKIASIGVHISRGVAIQGLSLNVDVRPEFFGALVSCGLRGIQMVNFRDHVAGISPTSLEIGREWVAQYGDRVCRRLQWLDGNLRKLEPLEPLAPLKPLKPEDP